jgi:phosphohistidine phosphatase SixA
VALVGHNPSMQALAVTLGAGSDHDDDDELARLAASFPTAAIAVFDTEADWAHVTPEGATQRSFVVPRS